MRFIWLLKELNMVSWPRPDEEIKCMKKRLLLCHERKSDDVDFWSSLVKFTSSGVLPAYVNDLESRFWAICSSRCNDTQTHGQIPSCSSSMTTVTRLRLQAVRPTISPKQVSSKAIPTTGTTLNSRLEWWFEHQSGRKPYDITRIDHWVASYYSIVSCRERNQRRMGGRSENQVLQDDGRKLKDWHCCRGLCTLLLT